MNELSELVKRLVDNEQRTMRLLRHLEAHGDLEESLRDISKGFREVNEELTRLTESTRVAVESLEEILGAFREAVEVLRRSDPAGAKHAVERLEEAIRGSERGIAEAVGKAEGSLASQQRAAVVGTEDLLKGVELRILEATDDASKKVENRQEHVERNLVSEGESIRRHIPRAACYATLLLAIVLLGLELYDLYPMLAAALSR